jgi:hypothetical protein
MATATHTGDDKHAGGNLGGQQFHQRAGTATAPSTGKHQCRAFRPESFAPPGLASPPPAIFAVARNNHPHSQVLLPEQAERTCLPQTTVEGIMKNRRTLAAGLLRAMASAPTMTGLAHAAISSSEAVTIDHNTRVSNLVGMTVCNDPGTVGKLEDVLVASGTTEASVILSVGDFGGGGENMVRVPLGHVHLATDKLAMPTAREGHLATMPAWTFIGLNGGG